MENTVISTTAENANRTNYARKQPMYIPRYIMTGRPTMGISCLDIRIVDERDEVYIRTV